MLWLKIGKPMTEVLSYERRRFERFPERVSKILHDHSQVSDLEVGGTIRSGGVVEGLVFGVTAELQGPYSKRKVGS